MQNFVTNNKTGALMTILVLAVGSVSVVETIQFVMGLDGDNINGSIIACVYGACKDNTFNGGTSSSGGGGGDGQPTPNTGTLIVTKVTDCGACQPSDFTIKVTGNNPSPPSFPGNKDGTEVTLGPGAYVVAETGVGAGITVLFEGDCTPIQGTDTASGDINAGERQKCTVFNTVNP